MPRAATFGLFYLAVFLQAGAYGLTFMLPRLFATFDANEKIVGAMLLITTLATLVSVSFSGHLSDWFGRVGTLAMACLSIAAGLALFGRAGGVGPALVMASVLLGAGWGLTYALAPIVLTRLVAGHERVRAFALLTVFVMAGFGFAPVIAARIEAAGGTIAHAFYLTAGLCFASAVIFGVLIGPVRRHAVNPGPEARSRLSIATIGAVLRSPARLPVFMVFLGASVFAGLNNFQTVFADDRGLSYADFFLVYTLTVIACRIGLVRFSGGARPYLTIAGLQFFMVASVLLFLVSGSSQVAYVAVAILFGIGYGASYPILAAMAANDAEPEIVPQTLQLFALTYFVGIFGFPLIAGWLIVEVGTPALLSVVAGLAGIEAGLALRRGLRG